MAWGALVVKDGMSCLTGTIAQPVALAHLGCCAAGSRLQFTARMASPRNLAAALAGTIIYTGTLFRFLPYADRNRLGADVFLLFAGLVLCAGFVAGLGATARYRTAGWVILGVWVAHALVVAVDLRNDPTDHNLLPFEFIIFGVCALPVYIGAALAHVADTLRRPRRG